MNLTGYQLKTELYKGYRTIVYRGEREVDRLPVAIKFLKNPYPNFSELVQFRNQYTIAKNLNYPQIIQTYSLENYQHSYALVMEDFGGVALSNYFKLQSKLPGQLLPEFLSIALVLCDALDLLYRERVIHKDIKPSNILINPQTKEVKLIDFSIASLLPRETQTLLNPNVLEGTLAYISPEQTGRMNRGIDYRTDFYSLGITFYELLTGELPFQWNDPMELVHCHIAKRPKLVNEINPEIPAVLSEIVSKLMAKNAEDRYQSALGLKWDLEQCWQQLQTKGHIEAFPIAQRDLCDRFIVPDQLYGRDREVQSLLEAFERVSRGATEMMLVAGFSGIGKTAVVNEVHKPIVRQRGYFIKGKFDQFQRNIPFSAFVQAFRYLMGELLTESDVRIQEWKHKILEAFGENGQVLIDVIPELEKIIGPQLPALELSGTAAENRFNLLFQNFIQVFTTADHPLVIFLDDLQWADSASLQLMKVLMNDNGYLLMLGAYRDNEVSPAHPFILTVEELKKAGANVHTITLNPLAVEHTNHLIADTLHCSPELALPLTQLVDRKTKGNPFFTTQFLKALHEDGYITFNGDRRYWECDITQINALALTDDVVEFMALQLQKLPEKTQQVLKLAACVGNQFDLATLAIISEQSLTETATALWKALQEGFILPNSQVYKFFQSEESKQFDRQKQANPAYRFLHDRVQQAAYSLIDPARKQLTHLTIGQLLQTKLSAAEQEEKLFDIVGHLNLGRELLTDRAERQALAQGNLDAAQKAKSATAYVAARNFVQTGLSLLTSHSWQDRYDLSLQLHVLAAEVAYLVGDFEDMERQSQLVLDAAKTVLDKVEIYAIQINARSAQNQMAEAISVGSNALAQLGIEFSPEANQATTEKTLQDLALQLENLVIEDLVQLPIMTDPHIIAAMKLMAILFVPIKVLTPVLLPLLCAKMVGLSLQFGNSSVSAMGYLNYGLVLINFGDVEQGYRFGKVALDLLDRFHSSENRAMVLLFFGALIQHRKQSLQSTVPLLKEGYLLHIETGGLLYAGYSINNYLYNQFFSGFCLADLEIESKKYVAVMTQMKQDNPLIYTKIKQQTIDNLIVTKQHPDLLIGDVYDETVIFPQYIRDNELMALAWACICKLMLAYLFGYYDRGLTYIDTAYPYLGSIAGFFQIPIFYFYAGLTYLTIAATESNSERSHALTLAEQQQAALSEWARSAPMNHQHKVDLLEAEKCRFLGKLYEAGDFYDRAIAGAKDNGFVQEEALANELAARFYLDWGKEKVAAGYMQEAYYCYARWGAKAKVNDLEQRYPQLLSPILQPATQRFTTLEALASISSVTYSSSEAKNSTSTSINAMLDLAAVIRASQSLASAIQLDELLQQLTQIILQYSGGDRCALLVPDVDGEWQVRAIATPESTELCTQPIEGNSQLPIKLIQYVKHTQETVVVNDGKTDLPVMGEYLNREQPKSVSCLPILNQGNPIGMLYLQNQTTSNVFTSDRLLILNFLCAQAAISLENARLYQKAQVYAQQLEQSQLQIVQSEKMASLGNLVAGVAHEINNPLGFLSGSIDSAKDYMQDLFEHIALYQQYYPQPATAIGENCEDIELEFLWEDFPKLLDSMASATTRIKGISNSLRTFSRADCEHKVSADLHEGIESTLLILKYRFKANENRPAIEVIKDYGDLPIVECFPGQLNQVFMNILDAIDMFDEMALSLSFAELESHPQQMIIQTQLIDKAVEIRIQDNGKGMTEEVKAKIFDHLFTTKAVGKGTGLGLAIAKSIVVEKHGGSLEVHSILGSGTVFIITLPIQ